MNDITVDKEKKEVRWNINSCIRGLAPSSHKFSLLDAIEHASFLLETDYVTEAETVTVGSTGRLVVETLPQLLMRSSADGLMPSEDGKGVIGTIGRRTFYWKKDPALTDLIVVENPRTKATVIIIHNEAS